LGRAGSYFKVVRDRKVNSVMRFYHRAQFFSYAAVIALEANPVLVVRALQEVSLLELLFHERNARRSAL